MVVVSAVAFALLLVGPGSLIFAVYSIRYRLGNDSCEEAAGRWLKVFVFWLAPLIGMIFVRLGPQKLTWVKGINGYLIRIEGYFTQAATPAPTAAPPPKQAAPGPARPG